MTKNLDAGASEAHFASLSLTRNERRPQAASQLRAVQNSEVAVSKGTSITSFGDPQASNID
eukprot:1178045-Karenia_brevis.AAC.1